MHGFDTTDRRGYVSLFCFVRLFLPRLLYSGSAVSHWLLTLFVIDPRSSPGVMHMHFGTRPRQGRGRYRAEEHYVRLAVYFALIIVIIVLVVASDM